MKKLAMVLVCFTSMAVPHKGRAANARDYVPLPDRTFLFCSYLKHISANDLYTNGQKTSSDFNLNENLGILRPVYYMKLGKALYGDGGLVIDPQALLPFGDAHVDGAAVNQASLQSSGIVDPTVLATLWFVNDPAGKLWMGFTPYLTIPLGAYDKQRTFNLGNNRWAFKPEMGIVKGVGKFYLDLIANVEFYTANDQFNAGGAQVKKEQDPLLGAEAHLSYDINASWYASVDYFFNYGGQTQLAGVLQRDTQRSHGLGLSFYWLLGTNNQLLLEYRQDFSVRNGPATDTLGARWAHFF